MVRIQPKEIVDELRSEFRRALEDAINEVIQDAEFALTNFLEPLEEQFV